MIWLKENNETVVHVTLLLGLKPKTGQSITDYITVNLGLRGKSDEANT